MPTCETQQEAFIAANAAAMVAFSDEAAAAAAAADAVADSIDTEIALSLATTANDAAKVAMTAAYELHAAASATADESSTAATDAYDAWLACERGEETNLPTASTLYAAIKRRKYSK